MEALNSDMYFYKNTYHTTPTPALFKSGVKEIFEGFESTFPMDVWLMVNGRKPTTTRITITGHKDDQTNFISKVEDEYEIRGCENPLRGTEIYYKNIEHMIQRFMNLWK